MKRLVIALSSVALLTVVPEARGQAAAQQEIYVPNPADGDVSVLDAQTLQTLARIPVSDPSLPYGPEAVAFSADGRFAFISFLFVPEQGVAVIDTATRTVIKNISIHPKEDSLIFARPGGDRVYVTDCSSSGVISVIDVAAQEAIDVDPATPELDGIATPGRVWALGFSPDGRVAWGSACVGDPGIYRIDLVTNVVDAFIPLATGGENVNGMEVSPNGRIAVATGGPFVIVVDLEQNVEVGRLQLAAGTYTQGVEFSSDGSRAYVVTRDQLLTVDVTTPSNPQLLSAVTIETEPSPFQGFLWELEVAGDRAYLTFQNEPSEVIAFDLSTAPPLQLVHAAVGNQAFEIGLRPLPVVTLSIDIKPHSFPNSVNVGSNGTLSVAILSTPTLDATTVDPTTVTLASAPVRLSGRGAPMTSFQDVNGDGLLDLVVQVSTEALQVSTTDTQAVLEGETFDGTRIRGADTVRVVP